MKPTVLAWQGDPGNRLLGGRTLRRLGVPDDDYHGRALPIVPKQVDQVVRIGQVPDTLLT
jgi:hypothetical protein